MAADVCPNLHVDTSSSNNWTRYTPGLTLQAVFASALAVLGPRRVLFGTDSSFFPRGWQQGVYEEQKRIVDALERAPQMPRSLGATSTLCSLSARPTGSGRGPSFRSVDVPFRPERPGPGRARVDPDPSAEIDLNREAPSAFVRPLNRWSTE